MARYRALNHVHIMSTRRQFLSAALVGLTAKGERHISGSFVNESQIIGHKIRDHAVFPAPKVTRKVPIVIVGGGIAGLSAAWRLDKRGFRDFLVLEMDKQAGGNARSGENEVSPYPWAAHYIPVPNIEAVYVRELMEELGVLKDGKWEERYLCFAPQERLFLHGRWQEGLEPDIALTKSDREQFRRFDSTMKEFRSTRQFTIPMEIGSKLSPLDNVSMEQWMAQQKFDSPYLRWYADYACRDDYGAKAKDTSAWAGVHYYASREHDEKGPLTWPEGNGWILKKLLAKLSRYVRTESLVHRIALKGRKISVFAGSTEYIVDAVIFAAPTFLARYLLENPPGIHIEYSPWLTANLTLERLPKEKGLEVAWDNVIYDSAGLGYVDATHMSLGTHREKSVWTYYWALADGTPAQNRQLLLNKDWNYFKDAILSDLSRAHPDIGDCVSTIDIMRIGHAMARPTPGSIFSEARMRLAKQHDRILFANSDVSGFSIFEEAQYRGVKAADAALKFL
jgi:glycine/D-amino acid oxidase-like deaminating enzyme